MKYRVDTVFYNIGKVIWIPVFFAGIWFAQSGFAEFKDLFACDLQRISGLPCPGCGGTRAVYYLCLGNPVKSFMYHPAVLYGVFAYLHFMGLYFYRKHIAGTIENREILIPNYMYVAIVVILLQWIVKIIKILQIL